MATLTGRLEREDAIRIDSKLLLICLVACGSHAIAADPPVPSAPTEQTQTAAPAATAAPAPDATPKPTASSSTTTASSSPAASDKAAAAKVAAATDAQNKKFRKMGYTPRMRGGETYYCREEVVVGSRFSKSICGTADEIERGMLDGRNMTDHMQSQPLYTPPPGH